MSNLINHSVCICPGHYDSYKGVNKNGFFEYDETNKIVKFVAEQLKDKVEVTVANGSLIEKIKVIETNIPDIAIEIHLGNANNPGIGGSRGFFMLNSDESKSLTDSLVESCVRMLGTKNCGSFIGWYKKVTPKMVQDGKAPSDWKAKIDLFLSKTPCPSAIIEPFFISSMSDCKRFIINNKHEFVAESISDGILRYFKKIDIQD